FDGTSWDCVLQGALSTFSNTSSFFWTMAIALYLYITIVRGSPTGTGLLCCFHAVRWVLSRGPARAGGLDPWVPTLRAGAAVPRVPLRGEALGWLLESPALESLELNALCVALCSHFVSHLPWQHADLSEYRPILSRAPALQPRTSVADKKLILIPVIFIILRIWSTVRFVLTLCNSPAVQNSVLVVLHGIGNTFQGGANCIMFVLCTRVVRTRLFSSICCCCPDELDWPLQRSNGSWQRPGPHKDKD
ncbi:GP157 protein, partial [Columbina picui]|nr:GP157 protein [Columbina picui]